MSKAEQTVHIDGREGGGQILRSALSLSMLTGKPVRLRAIRAGRRKPGLLRQHLTAVQAAAAVCGGRTEGATLGSGELTFTPGPVRAGEYSFAIGTAGSTGLVLQTVLPALLRADGPSLIELQGGTHNPAAPPFDFLSLAFLPQLTRLGPKLRGELLRYGFYPAGGGRCVFHITPAATLQPLTLDERGALRKREAVAVWANLPLHVAERELRTLAERLDWPANCTRYRELSGYDSPGNYLAVQLSHEQGCEVFSGFGRAGVSAEKVAKDCAREARRYLAAEIAVGEHLADQLLLPLALAGGSFTTLKPSHHTLTNIAVIERFLPLRFTVDELGHDRWRIAV